jgi:hypothetical protein
LDEPDDAAYQAERVDHEHPAPTVPVREATQTLGTSRHVGSELRVGGISNDLASSNRPLDGTPPLRRQLPKAVPDCVSTIPHEP